MKISFAALAFFLTIHVFGNPANAQLGDLMKSLGGSLEKELNKALGGENNSGAQKKSNSPSTTGAPNVGPQKTGTPKILDSQSQIYSNISSKEFCVKYFEQVKINWSHAEGAYDRDLVSKGGYPKNLNQACENYALSIGNLLNKPLIYDASNCDREYPDDDICRLYNGGPLVLSLSETTPKEKDKINHFRIMRVSNYFEYNSGAPKKIGIPLRLSIGYLVKGRQSNSKFKFRCKRVMYVSPGLFNYGAQNLSVRFPAKWFGVWGINFTKINLPGRKTLDIATSEIESLEDALSSSYDSFNEKFSLKKFYKYVSDSGPYYGEKSNKNYGNVVTQGGLEEGCSEELDDVRESWTRVY